MAIKYKILAIIIVVAFVSASFMVIFNIEKNKNVSVNEPFVLSPVGKYYFSSVGTASIYKNFTWNGTINNNATFHIVKTEFNYYYTAQYLENTTGYARLLGNWTSNVGLNETIIPVFGSNYSYFGNISHVNINGTIYNLGYGNLEALTTEWASAFGDELAYGFPMNFGLVWEHPNLAVSLHFGFYVIWWYGEENFIRTASSSSQWVYVNQSIEVSL